MPQKHAEARVAFEEWQGRRSGIYTVRVGPATCEISHKERVLRLMIFGRVQNIPLGGGTALTYVADWGSLQVTDCLDKLWTELKLTWDDRFEERGARASEYVSVGTAIAAAPQNQVAWSKFDVNSLPYDDTSVKSRYRTPEEQSALEKDWGKIRDDIRVVKHFDQSLGQTELVKLTSPAVWRDKRVLLCV